MGMLVVVFVLGFVSGWILRAVLYPVGSSVNSGGTVATGFTPTVTPGMIEPANFTPTPAPTCIPMTTNPWPQRVVVGPDACTVLPDTLTITASKDSIQWGTTGAGTQALWIDFNEEIFCGMTQPSLGTYRVPCVGTQCYSGPVKSYVTNPPPGTTKTYKYSQTLGAGKPCDARVIIKW